MLHGPDARAWARTADAALARAVADAVLLAARSRRFPLAPEELAEVAARHGLVARPWPGPAHVADLGDLLAGRIAAGDAAAGLAARAIAFLTARGLAAEGGARAGAAKDAAARERQDLDLGAALGVLAQEAGLPLGEAMAFEPALDDRPALWRGLAAPALQPPPAPPHPWAYSLVVFARSPEDGSVASHRAALLALRARGARAALVLGALRSAGSPGVLRALLSESSLLDPGGAGEKLLISDDPRDLALGVAALHLGAPRPLETLRRSLVKRLARSASEREGAAWLTELYALTLLAPASALRERLARLIADEVVERAEGLAGPLAAVLGQTADYRRFRRALLAADVGEALARRGSPAAAGLLRAAVQVFTRSLTPTGLNHALHDELFVWRVARALAALFAVDDAANGQIGAFIDSLPTLAAAWPASPPGAMGLLAERCAEVILGASARASTAGRSSAADRLGAVALRLADRHGREMWATGASGRLLRYRAEGLSAAGIAAEESRRQAEREPPSTGASTGAGGAGAGIGEGASAHAPAPAPAEPAPESGKALHRTGQAPAPPEPSPESGTALHRTPQAPAPAPPPPPPLPPAPAALAPAPPRIPAPASPAPVLVLVQGRVRPVLPPFASDLSAWMESLGSMLLAPIVRRDVQLTLATDGSVHVLESRRAWPAAARVRRAVVPPGRLSVARLDRRLSLGQVALRSLPLLFCASLATVLLVTGSWARSPLRTAGGVALLVIGVMVDFMVQRWLGAARARSVVCLRLGSRLMGVQLDRASADTLLAAMGYGVAAD